MRGIIAGVPGVGKSTIVSRMKSGIRVVNFGDVMLEEAKRFGISSRDEMREKIDPEKYKELQKEAAKKIGGMNDILVDTHLSILMPSGFYPGMPMDVVELIRPDVIFLIEKDPEIIAEQARKDASRKRVTNPALIALHQQMNRMYAASISEMLKCFVKVIIVKKDEKYEFEGAEAAAKEIDKVVMEWNS